MDSRKLSLSDIARQAVVDYTEMLDPSIIPGSMQPNTQAIRSMKHALARAQAALAQQASQTSFDDNAALTGLLHHLEYKPAEPGSILARGVTALRAALAKQAQPTLESLYGVSAGTFPNVDPVKYVRELRDAQQAQPETCNKEGCPMPNNHRGFCFNQQAQPEKTNDD